jgi:hypothetical protein
MTPEEQEVADKTASEKGNASKSKKKTIGDLKSTDTVIVGFRNPVHVEEDGENTTRKEDIEQHVKYEYWLSLAKDSKGNPKFSTLRGAKLLGYVDENGKETRF